MLKIGYLGIVVQMHNRKIGFHYKENPLNYATEILVYDYPYWLLFVHPKPVLTLSDFVCFSSSWYFVFYF